MENFGFFSYGQSFGSAGVMGGLFSQTGSSTPVTNTLVETTVAIEFAAS